MHATDQTKCGHGLLGAGSYGVWSTKTWCKARELQNGQLEHRPASETAGAVAGAIETWVFAWELAGVAEGQATVGRRELGLRENQEREAGPGLVVSRKSGPAHEGWLHGSVLALREGGMSQLA